MNRSLLSAIALAANSGLSIPPSSARASDLADPPYPEPAPARKPRACSVDGCTRRATHLAGILLRRADEDRGQVAYLDLPVCPSCRRRLQVRDVLTDAGWKKIEELGKAKGFVPRRDLCRLHTVELNRAPARFRDRYEE